MKRQAFGLAGVLAAAWLGGCASPPPRDGELHGSAWAQASVLSASSLPAQRPAWEHFAFPGKSPVRFVPIQLDGRDAIEATAVSAASVVRKKLRVDPSELGQLRFSWRVPQLIESADIGTRESDDAPVRVILAFEGDRSRLSARDAMLSELMRTLTGEEMPYATLMYVWCNRRPVGTVVASPRTDRIRKLVLQSGPGALGRWLDYERDVRADFERVFGEPPGALVGVAIMTDSDNTRTTARAFYGPVRHVSGRLAAR